MVLDRRVADPGPEEEQGEVEPDEAESLKMQEPQGSGRLASPWDDPCGMEDAPRGLQMLLAPLTAVLQRRDPLGLQEGADHRPTGPSSGFLKERREGGKGGLPAGDCTIPAELHLVERALSQAPKPAVERREVRLRGGGVVVGHRRAKAMGAREVALGEVCDDRKREGLVRQEIRGEQAAPGAAGSALRDGDPYGAGAVERDGLPRDAASRQPERPGSAVVAGEVRKKAPRLRAAILVDVREKRF